MAEPAAGPSAAETGVLSVSVSDPVTQGEGPRSFVTFRVATTTDLAAFKWKSFSVIRRFRDFAFLHDRLSDLYPGEQCTASSHSPRRRGCSPAAVVTGAAEERDVQYEVLRSYYSELEGYLQECTATSETLVRRQGKLSQSLHEFGCAVRDLGTAAGCEEPAGSTLANLATCCLALAAQGEARAQTLTQALEAPMRDLVRSMSGVKGALASRAGAHATHRQLVADLEAKRTRIAKTRESGRGDATRLDADEREAAATSLRVEQAAAEYEAVCCRMEGELQVADAQRAAALGAIGRALGAAQRDMARDQAQAFRLMGVNPSVGEAGTRAEVTP